MTQILIIIILFWFGAATGSFLGALIHRLRKNDLRGFIFGRSNCPHCSKQLSARDLIPLFSYLLLKGRCRFCQRKISPTYLALEIITGLTFAFAFTAFPQGLDGTSDSLFFALTLAYLAILIFTAFYDFLYFEIVDAVLIPAIILAIIALAHPLSPDPKSAALGVILIFSFFYGQILISKGRWIGGGDLRIAIFMGLILGLQNTIVALILAYLLGSIVSVILISTAKLKLRSEIPFAPFLCLASFIAFYYGDSLAGWYLKLLSL